MINIADIVIEDKRWSDFGIQDLADRTFSIVFDVLNLSKKWEISILACNDAKIIELNSTFRDKPIATNVLSWPAHNLKSIRSLIVSGSNQSSPRARRNGLAYMASAKGLWDAGMAFIRASNSPREIVPG